MSAEQKNTGLKKDKREVILQAAWGLIRHYGYNKTTIDDIAKRARVGKGTVYLYFRSKAEVRNDAERELETNPDQRHASVARRAARIHPGALL